MVEDISIEENWCVVVKCVCVYVAGYLLQLEFTESIFFWIESKNFYFFQSRTALK
jgi:hypothetical protein